MSIKEKEYAIKFRITDEQQERLEQIMKMTGKTFKQLIVEHIIEDDPKENQTIKTLKKMLDLEETYFDQFWKVDLTEENKLNIHFWKKGDLIITHKNNNVIITSINVEDKTMRAIKFPYKAGDVVLTFPIETFAEMSKEVLRT